LKPWVNEKLLATLSSALNLKKATQTADKLETVNQQLQQDMARSFSDIVGQSAAMQKIFGLIEKVAPTDANVLILGENGTGKEVVARAIHANSLRKDQSFIGIDVGSLPPNLFESELFGHTKGAFTDAQNSRIGRFEMANSGTLFLDEIGNIPFWLQAKLLTALQTRTVTPVGSIQNIPIDIRLICATNQPLQSMIEEKRFREDLHYRINTIEINLPPLRDREEDIELLSKYFLQQYGQKYNKPDLRISLSAMKRLRTYNWPGNVRELQHAMERAVILANTSVLEMDSFLFPQKQNTNGLMLEDYNLQNAEKQLILKVLERTEGNISKSAKQLGLTRAALYRRLEKYGF
jgi:transcriptional regulator with PAS, ATPase and Fis domain